ncbi:MAG: pitrilysin family protein [candidate division WOR-3 bacterium]
MKRLLFTLLPVFLIYGLKIEREVLNNNLVVIAVEDHKIPMVDLALVIKAGSSLDPKNKDGLANFCSKLLTYGTRTRSALEIAREIESIGSSLTTNCTEDYITIRARTLSSYLEKVTELVADCTINPKFDTTEIKRVRGEIISQIKQESDNPFSLVDQTYRELLFRDLPYGHRPIGFDSTIKNIERIDLLNFYHLTFTPENSFLVVVGDFKTNQLLEMLKRYFGQWKGSDAILPDDFLRPREVVYPPILRPRGKIVKRDISQSYILLGHYGISGSSPDWLKVRLMNFALGGSGLTSRMALNIREEKGLAYIVYSWFEKRCQVGAFICEVQTKNETCELAIRQLLEEMKKMKQGGIRQEELVDAQNYFTGNFPLRYDSYSEKVDLLIEMELFNLGEDYIDKFTERIKAVSIEEINQMAKDYLHPENYVVAIVGDVRAEDLNIPDIEWEE